MSSSRVEDGSSCFLRRERVGPAGCNRRGDSKFHINYSFLLSNFLLSVCLFDKVLDHPPRSIYNRVPLSRRDELFKDMKHNPSTTVIPSSEGLVRRADERTLKHDTSLELSVLTSTASTVTQEVLFSQLSNGNIEAEKSVYENSHSLSSFSSHGTIGNIVSEKVELLMRPSPLTGRVRIAGSKSLGSLINERLLPYIGWYYFCQHLSAIP